MKQRNIKKKNSRKVKLRNNAKGKMALEKNPFDISAWCRLLSALRNV